MAQITLKGNAIQTIGELPAKGTKAPDFELIKNDLSKVSLKDFAGQRLVLNIFQAWIPAPAPLRFVSSTN